MHPVLTRHRLPYTAIFLVAGLLVAPLLRTLVGASWSAALLVGIGLCGVHAFNCLAAWYVVQRLPLRPARPLAPLFGHLPALAVTSALTLALTRGLALLGAGVAPSFVGDAPAVAAGATPLLAVLCATLYVAVASVHYGAQLADGRQHADARAYALQLRARDAELRALRAQLDPHFLFNALNAVSALVPREPSAAQDLCAELAHFLRLSLHHGAGDADAEPADGIATVALQAEIDLVRAYLAIQRARFGDRLRVDVQLPDARSEHARDERSGNDGDAAPQVRAWPILPLLLQPLVENAVKHGVATRQAASTIAIDASIVGRRLRIAITNPYAVGDLGLDADEAAARADDEAATWHAAPARTDPAALTGVGWTNVRQRLALAYDGAADARAQHRPPAAAQPGIFRVVLHVPARPRNVASSPLDEARPS
ncbi:MAG: histidine kinase [Acidobacteriota bacterium]